MDALWRETTATSRIQLTQELNRSSSRGSAVLHKSDVPKLKRAGADTVISPAVIGGRLLVRSALGERGMEGLADRIADAADTDGADDERVS